MFSKARPLVSSQKKQKNNAGYRRNIWEGRGIFLTGIRKIEKLP